MKFLQLSTTLLLLFLCFSIVHCSSEDEQPALTKEQLDKLHQAFFKNHMKNFQPPPENARMVEDLRKLNEKLTMDGLTRLKQLEEGLPNKMRDLTGMNKNRNSPAPPKNHFKKNKKDEL
jgi:hypothetical protein